MPKQTPIICAINTLLARKGSSLVLNQEGVCHGLAISYMKKCLEGKEKIFFEQLERIIQSDPNDIINDLEINLLISEIEFAFHPHVYNQEISQDDIEKIAPFVSQVARHDYTLSVAVSQESWKGMLSEIIKDGAVFSMSSYNHTLSVFKKDGRYHLYNPENKTKFAQIIDTEEALIKTAAKALKFETPCLPFEIKIFSSQRDNEQEYPTKSNLFKKHVNAHDWRIEDGKFGALSLELSSKSNDPESVEYLNKAGFSDAGALARAAKGGYIPILDILLDRPGRSIINLILPMAAACTSGHEESMIRLIDKFKALNPETTENKSKVRNLQRFLNDMHLITGGRSLIHLAAGSRSSKCFELVLNLSVNETHKKPEEILEDLTQDEDKISALTIATRAGGREIASIICRHLPELSQQEKTYQLENAIIVESTAMISFWGKQCGPESKKNISAERLNTISLDTVRMMLTVGFQFDDDIHGLLATAFLKGNPKLVCIICDEFLKTDEYADDHFLVEMKKYLEMPSPTLKYHYTGYGISTLQWVVLREGHRADINDEEILSVLHEEHKKNLLQQVIMLGYTHLASFLIAKGLSLEESLLKEILTCAIRKGQSTVVQAVICAGYRFDDEAIIHMAGKANQIALFPILLDGFDQSKMTSKLAWVLLTTMIKADIPIGQKTKMLLTCAKVDVADWLKVAAESRSINSFILLMDFALDKDIPDLSLLHELMEEAELDENDTLVTKLIERGWVRGKPLPQNQTSKLLIGHSAIYHRDEPNFGTDSSQSPGEENRDHKKKPR